MEILEFINTFVLIPLFYIINDMRMEIKQLREKTFNNSTQIAEIKGFCKNCPDKFP